MFSRKPSTTPNSSSAIINNKDKIINGARASIATSSGMPDKKELDRQYLALLEELAIPENKRMFLLQSDDETKWKLV